MISLAQAPHGLPLIIASFLGGDRVHRKLLALADEYNIWVFIVSGQQPLP
ncbi:hypothetical protein ACFLRM_02380 [Acidobacteriota bacterium]